MALNLKLEFKKQLVFILLEKTLKECILYVLCIYNIDLCGFCCQIFCKL